jgi:hypothetical protein
MKQCERCKGETVTHSHGFTSVEGKVYPSRTDTCICCKGEGFFPEIDESAIIAAIVAKQGKNKGQLRASMTSNFSDRDAARAYYVWRLARFHGGKDVTMPMMADLAVRGDPFKAELDKLADAVAKQYFGTDMAAAHRWGRALGFIG